MNKTNKSNMMSGMMVAASLFAVSACGAVQAPKATEDSTGETDGSGSGSDVEAPVSCTKASECADGMACDFDILECVATALVIDGAEFVDDGMRWWTNTNAPALSGTFEAPDGATISVKVGATEFVATITGSRWSIVLPSGSISATDTPVTVTLTEPSGGRVVNEKILALDTTAPMIALASSKVRDERADVISFAATGPVHDHKGAEADLVAGCPTIYKYGYLMSAQAPTYGTEVSVNPLVWRAIVADTKIATAEYRVMKADGSVARGWTSTPPGPNLAVALYRDGATGIPELGTTAGTYTIEMRVRDWANNESLISGCWNHVPLAAPLEITAATAATSENALSTWTFEANSPISRLVNTNGAGAQIVEQRIVQHSAESVPLNVMVAQPTVNYTRTSISGLIPFETAEANLSCGSFNCGAVPAAPTVSSTAGLVYSFNSRVVLTDGATGAIIPLVNGTATLPARDVNEAPHAYVLSVWMDGVSALRAPYATAHEEFTINSLSYTGLAPGAEQKFCIADMETRFGVNCVQTRTYRMVTALDRATLAISPVTFTVKTAPAGAVPSLTPPHVPAARFTSPAISWSAGDENLNGY